jgi:general L-amino acid transport system permease protein
MSGTHAHSSFVRTEMLPEQTPPVTQTGAIKWLRENLFSSWINAILTILSLYVIYWVISHVAGWLFLGIWDAGSLSECREIRDATYGEGSNVACWAVLTDRWDQLMFGFYPPELYWRPVLALILFLVAISPVLYDTLPRKMLLFTVISPFVLFWLLWGGTIWGPIAVAAGFVLGWAVVKFAAPVIGQLGGIIAGVVVPILYWLFAVGPVAGTLGSIIPIGIEFVPSDDFGGFMLAFVIGIAGIILSLPLGIVLALGRQSDLFIINKFSVFFIEVIRGVPLIVWLFTASLLLNYFLPPGTNFDLMRISDDVAIQIRA